MTFETFFEKLNIDEIIQWIISNPRKKTNAIKKITIRPIEISSKKLFHIESFTEKQAFHENINLDGLLFSVKKHLANSAFKQLDIFTSEIDYHVLINKQGDLMVKQNPATKEMTKLQHNQKKKYILEEGTPIPFLIALGIMTKTGKVVDKMYKKFRQVNRFVELIDDVIDEIDSSIEATSSKDKQFKIIDFGSGKSYLTFALYHYLVYIKKFSVQITGLDLKEDVINDCNRLKNQLGYDSLNFIVGDINEYDTSDPIDMVITLHACNTATDAALKKAVGWGSKIIMSVPCCHKEFNHQIDKKEFYGLLEHGIVKERVSALMTDAFRSKWLEAMGYKVQLLEFVDMTHTPKNIMIRAIKVGEENKLLLNEAIKLQTLLGLDLSILKGRDIS
jgi:hypothetical protein